MRFASAFLRCRRERWRAGLAEGAVASPAMRTFSAEKRSPGGSVNGRRDADTNILLAARCGGRAEGSPPCDCTHPWALRRRLRRRDGNNLSGRERSMFGACDLAAKLPAAGHAPSAGPSRFGVRCCRRSSRNGSVVSTGDHAMRSSAARSWPIDYREAFLITFERGKRTNGDDGRDT